MPKLIDYIKSTFEELQPFMYDEITTAGFDLEEAEELVKKGELKKLYNDAYYYNDDKVFADLRPDPTSYVSCKYIYRLGKWIGYYNNLNLDNLLRISTQCPFKTFVASNLIKEEETLVVDYLRYVFTPPYAYVTDENVNIQKAVDVIYRGIYPGLYKSEQKTFRKYLADNNITLNVLQRFIDAECEEKYKARILLNLSISKLY